jgi:HK97 family phage portal protein
MATGPVTLGPGRADLRWSSSNGFQVSAQTSVALVNRRVSYAQLFATQPMVAAAVMRLLSWSVRVPLKLYRRTGDDSRQRLFPGEHPLADAIQTPWERGNSAQLVMSLLGPLLVHGNGLAAVDEGAGGKIQFLPADYRYARPIMPWRDTIAGWDIDFDHAATHRTVAADKVLHVAWWSPLSPLGVSPLQQLGITLSIEDAAQRHQQAMLRNGARPPSAIMASTEFIQQDSDFKREMMNQLRGDITELYSGPENSGRPALLPPGLDWKQVGHTAVEAELIAQRQVAREEVGAVYHLAPGVFGFHLDKGNTLGEQRQMSYVDGLLPPLVLIEQVINSQLIRALLREDDIFVEHDFAGIMRGNSLDEIRAISEAIRAAQLTPNEGRSVMNRAKSDSPGMDSFYLERNNLWPLDQPYPDGPSGKGGAGATDPNAPSD